MKKKVVFIALSIALVLSLCACDELLSKTSGPESSKSTESSQTEVSVKEESSESETEPSAVSEDDSSVDDESSEESEAELSDVSSETESSAESNVSEEPSNLDVSMVIYDKNGIKITYKGLENQYGITTSIKLLLENSNSEKYTVQTTDVSIDGFTYSTIMSTSIASNKKASDSVVILDSDFKENGTSYEKIKTAEIGFVIWGESNVLEQVKDTVTFTIQ